MAPLVTALQAKEARRQELLTAMSQLRARPEASKLQRSLVEAELYKRLLTWRTLLEAHTPHARQLLKKLLRTPMRLVPEHGVYRWSAEIVLGKFFLGILDPTMVVLDPTMVASPRGCALVGAPQTFVEGDIAA